MSRKLLLKSFDKLRTNGNFLNPFVEREAGFRRACAPLLSA